MHNIYDQDLPRNTANFTALSPLSFIERTAEVYPDRLAVVHGPLRRTWGEVYARLRARGFVVTEACQDRLLLEDSPALDVGGQQVKAWALKAARCCFPTYMSYAVRPGNQWTVVGSQSGYLHHTVPDPAPGACRTSCEPYKERMSVRASRPGRMSLNVGDS